MKNNLTLLYVEDDKVIRENFTQIFEVYFNTVLTTDNGNHALELYKENTIDVAILDISIPGLNGLSLAEKIRRVDEDILLFIISAHSDEKKLLKAINLKLFGYLVKPVTHQRLYENIQKILNSFTKEINVSLPYHYYWDKSKMQLLYKKEIVSLTKNEIKILKLLIQNRNTYFNASEIYEKLRDETILEDASSQNITQLISRLKKKLLKVSGSSDFFIENCYGLGYRIT